MGRISGTVRASSFQVGKNGAGTDALLGYRALH